MRERLRALDSRSSHPQRGCEMPGALRVLFSPDQVSVDTVRTEQPRAGLRLTSLGPPPTALPEKSRTACTLQFFVSYIAKVREGSPSTPKPFARLSGELERQLGKFEFRAAPDAKLEHDPLPPPAPDADPRRVKPLEYLLTFARDQFPQLGEQTLKVPRPEGDEPRFVQLSVEVTVSGAPEVVLATSDVWDVPYATPERRVRLSIFDPITFDMGAMLLTKADGDRAFNGVGDRVGEAREFDLTALPADDDYDFELSLGDLRLAPPLTLKIKDLELGLLLEDVQRAAESIVAPDKALPDQLSGSEDQDFGDLPFEEVPAAKRDFVVFTMQDVSGAPLAGRPFVAVLADGSSREGILDARGQATLTAIPRGAVDVTLFDQPDALLTLDSEAAP